MTPQAVVDRALRDERRDDHEAAVAQAETVVDPRSGRRVDRLLAEALAHSLREPALHLVRAHAELARVCGEAALVAVVHFGSVVYHIG